MIKYTIEEGDFDPEDFMEFNEKTNMPGVRCISENTGFADKLLICSVVETYEGDSYLWMDPTKVNRYHALMTLISFVRRDCEDPILGKLLDEFSVRLHKLHGD